ncbi:MAG: FecR family protein [Usitatibacter sp.]
MKKISVLLALMALFFADMVLAAAVATSTTGNVQVQTGTAPARTLRMGDEVNQGDTVFTGSGSSLVLKFDDGQVAALTSNSRMTISAYQYNAQAGTGNVLLSLIDGGMRAITGLIGRRSPNQVAYRAATATIGIRGTDVTIATSAGNVVVTVTEGAISFTFAGQTITVPAGQGVNAQTDGKFQQGAAQQILSQISPALAAAIGGLAGLNAAIQQASPGSPRQGGDNLQGAGPNFGTSSTPGPNTGSGTTGGGSASAR